MKRLASISLDLDDKWTYLKTHGDNAWQAYPSYLRVVVPRILAFLAKRKLTISFFVVGQDAVRTENRDLLRSIAEAGHEIANHTFRHDPWLHLYSRRQIDQELELAEQHIEDATGQRPTGFRGPGFSISRNTLRALIDRDYAYDASTLPNVLNPLARAYFLSNSKLEGEERARRKVLFGSAKDALRPCKPYYWELDGRQLLELPVTTIPLLKVPMHFSYLVYLSGYSHHVAKAYLRTALALCQSTRTEPSLLLHPLDFLGRDDEQDLSFFPGMNICGSRKLQLLDELVEIIQRRYQVVSMQEHVEDIERRGALPMFEARFRRPKNSGKERLEPSDSFEASSGPT